MTEGNHEPHIDRTARIALRWGLGASIFWTIFLWGFWDRGPMALGLNAFVCAGAILGLFLWVMRHKGVDLKANRWWIVPLCMIVASLFLYENPFFKLITLLVLPFATALFVNVAMLEDGKKTFWDNVLQAKFVSRVFAALWFLGKSMSAHTFLFSRPQKEGEGKVRRVIIGLLLLVAISFTAIIPLLSTADGEFAAHMKWVLDRFWEIVSADTVVRALCALVASVVVGATVLAWTRPFVHADKAADEKPTDSIVAGIVIGGMFALYLFFLGIQAKNLVVGRLPFAFEDAVQVVKSGFWQLLALTVINIGVFLAAYRKTIPLVQRMLVAFAIASLLLLASAAHRMALYVLGYGFSYEKFYASYAVLFCAILLGWLTFRLWSGRRADIAKFICVLLLWMFAAVAVFPVERFVLAANVALVQRPGTQIRLYELTMLSGDVVGAVERYKAEGKLIERAERLEREGEGKRGESDWRDWMVANRTRIAEKAWYELTLTNIVESLR